MSGTRLLARTTLIATVLALSGCAIYGHHGRVRVGVALPPIVIPIPIPRHEPQPEPHPQPLPRPEAPVMTPAPPDPVPAPEPKPAPVPAPVPAPAPAAGAYPSAGSPAPAAHAEHGSVRSIEVSPHRGMVRVGVMLDGRAMRYFDLPGTNLRVGERVRVEGDRIYRS